MKTTAGVVAVSLALDCLTACSSAVGIPPVPYSIPKPDVSTVRTPTKLNLYPSNDGNRFYIFATKVGLQPVSMPLVFDTGSAGITLDAQAIGFPVSMLAPTGFIFPAGISSLSYNGITVTNQTATRAYGGKDGTVEHGNIGFASVSFGDPVNSLRTKQMPIFLYYSITKAAPPYNNITPTEQGLFGVDDLADMLLVSASTPPAGESFPECSIESVGTCYVTSVLKYLGYVPPVDAGFMLTPAVLQNCTIAPPTSCVPASILTVGLDHPLEDSFSITALECPPISELPPYFGPQSLDGYLVCDKSIPDSTFTLSGATAGTLMGRVLFDTGTPAPYLYPSSASFPSTVADPTDVLVMLPNGFTYSYTTGTSPITETSVNPEANNEQNHIGISYFTTNSFFINYAEDTEGWM